MATTLSLILTLFLNAAGALADPPTTGANASTSASAAKPKIVKSAPNGRKYEDTYKLVCQGQDPDQLCGKISAEPKREVMDTIKKLQPVLHQAARTYGVDPAAIVGAILAEHSMNTSATDVAQDALVNSGLAANGTIDFFFFKRKFTYGFGQLHFERAMEAEEVAAQVEGRPKRSDQQVNDALMTPEGSMYYAAALIRQAQDLYLGAGYDLSDDPAVLTTLYNIGKIQERLDRTKQVGRPPQPNYFGTWVLKNLDQIQEVVGDYKPNGASLEDAASQAPADSPYLIRYQAKDTLKPLKSGMTSVGNNNAALAGTSFVLQAGDQFDLRGSVDDASLGTLHLVQSDDGQMGYLPEAVIAKKAQSVLLKKESCQANGERKCLDDMATYLTEKNGETYAHMTEQNQPAKPTLSPRELVLEDAKQRVEVLLSTLGPTLNWDDAEGAKALAQLAKLKAKLDPMFQDFPAYIANKLKEQEDKEKALQNLPKLEKNDMVEILAGIKDFRARVTKLNSRGTYSSPYVLLEPLLEFYESCAVLHHGSSNDIADYFNQEVIERAVYLNSDTAGVALRYGPSNTTNYSISEWVYNKLRSVGVDHGGYGVMPKATQKPSDVKGHEGEMVRVDDGENCYGDKNAFLAWLKKVPVRQAPKWVDLEPMLQKAAAFYFPITKKSDLTNALANLPAETARIRQSSAYALKKITEIKPELAKNLEAVAKQFTSKTKEEKISQHPLMKLFMTLRSQLTECRLAVVNSPETLKKLNAVEADLNAKMNDLKNYYQQNSGGGGYGGSLLSDQLQREIYEVLNMMNPDAGVPQEILIAMRASVPFAATMQDNIERYMANWVKFGNLLSQACGIFENPLYEAYLNNPNSLPPEAAACTLELSTLDGVYNDTFSTVATSLKDMKEKFPTEKERLDFINGVLDQQRMVEKAAGGGAVVNPARFPEYHTLVAELSKKDCVKAIFVSRVQELDLPKTVLLPDGNGSSVRIVWKGTKCN